MYKEYTFSVIFALMILAGSFLFYKFQDIKRTYEKEVGEGLDRIKITTDLLTEKDIQHLPLPVQKYLTYVGVMDHEKLQNAKITFTGKMRLDPKKNWLPIQSEQYNFFDQPTRVFYIRGNMSGVPILGLHLYKQGKAQMLIKLAGLITVADGQGPEMDKGETVTVFNDMCLFAPASLIDERIQWETVNSLTAKATFNNNGCKISALLYFNEKGALINFVTDDRYMTVSGNSFQQVKWSTPVEEYKELNGFMLPSKAEAIWHLPEGDYCYAKFHVKNVEYNRKVNN